MRLSLCTLSLTLLAAGATLQAADCDRACLAGFVTQYLDAMVVHNPAKLPLSASLRFTEDGVDMKLGEGLWKNASKVRTYREDVLDVPQGVAASRVVVEESGTPVLLAMRLKIADRKITEVETQVTRTQKEGALFVLDTLQTPGPMSTPLDKTQRTPREDLIKAALFYPAGLKIGSFVKVDAPFASDAYRLENGGRMAGKGCTRAGCEDIKGQKIMAHPGISTRVLAVDEETGVVLLRMNFGQTSSYGEGNALMCWEAFKIYGGQIHGVEAFMKIMPVGLGNGGWDTGAVN
jgi:hypothetical protein